MQFHSIPILWGRQLQAFNNCKSIYFSGTRKVLEHTVTILVHIIWALERSGCALIFLNLEVPAAKMKALGYFKVDIVGREVQALARRLWRAERPWLERVAQLLINLMSLSSPPSFKQPSRSTKGFFAVCRVSVRDVALQGLVRNEAQTRLKLLKLYKTQAKSRPNPIILKLLKVPANSGIQVLCHSRPQDDKKIMACINSTRSHVLLAGPTLALVPTSYQAVRDPRGRGINAGGEHLGPIPSPQERRLFAQTLMFVLP
ncbi:hypothetical protein B0H13DRAFT_1870446 [Mycena leptocephala]|nr:hypothetical protein B0H13DRAFT_1870446 [Mycena leptocephala]